MATVALPELGENVSTAVVSRLLVAVGDTVAKDQPVVELETDKATVEVPSSLAGVVTEIRVKAGDKLKTGDVVLSLGDASAADVPAEPRVSDTVPGTVPTPVPATVPATESTPAPAPVLTSVLTSVPAAAATAPPGVPAPPSAGITVTTAVRESPPLLGRSGVLASPAVRRLARELGIDPAHVAPTGPGGRLTPEDIKAHARSAAAPASAPGPGQGELPLPDLSKWGDVERVPMSGVRRKTAEHLSHAWSVIPHVTQYDKADITQLEELRRRFSSQVEARGGKLTMTAMLVKVLGTALQRFPQFNAAVDMRSSELIYRRYVNVGVAVDTDRGLLVPVVRNVDQKRVADIAIDVQALAIRAREKKLTLEEMSGGSMSLSNLGGIGGTHFTPLVNWPEVAILGVSRSVTEPVYVNGAFVPRLMLPLSLSYDHRAIDGADGIRFLRFVVESLEQPFLLAL